MTQELITGLQRALDRAFDGARDGLKPEATAVAQQMRTNHPHGNVTGATEAGYGARVVGRGETGGSEFNAEVSAAETLNPGHVATGSVQVGGIVGVIIDSKTDYQVYLETEHAGRDAVLGPTVASSGQRFTQAAARGAKKAWGG